MLSSELGASLENVESFQEVWASFARTYWNLSGKAQINPEEEAAFREMLRGTCERHAKLREMLGDPQAFPVNFAKRMEALAAYQGLASLSDAESARLRDLVLEVTRELGGWLAELRRKDLFRSGLGKSRQQATLKFWVLVPVFFGILVGFFVFLGVKFFLNRW